MIISAMRSKMKTTIQLITTSLLLSSCISSDTKTSLVNLTSSDKSIALYGFSEEATLELDDVRINLRLPPELKRVEMDNYTGQNLARFETSYEGDAGYSLSVDFLESRISATMNVDEIFDVLEKSVENDTTWLKAFPPFYKDLSLVSLGTNYEIDNKRFLRRITYYVDGRLSGTHFEDALVTEFHFVTYFHRKKFSFTLSHHGGDRGVAELIGGANTLAGTIKFSLIE